MADVTSTRLLLIRHGETEWSLTRRHTGRSDIPLTEAGERRARALHDHLPLDEITEVWSSPLQRARRTAELAGLPVDRIDQDLLEWDYGAAEGRTTDDIRKEIPGWDVWTGGVRMLGGGGESADEVGDRVDAVITRAKEVPGMVALVAHAHVLRILGARWIQLAPAAGRHLTLDTGGWAILGWERETPIIERWNPPAT